MSTDKPKIEFPCAYPIKVMGPQCEDFHSTIVAVIEQHDPAFDHASISIRESRQGNYLSLNLTITATGPEQLRALFEDLKATGRVSMVL